MFRKFGDVGSVRQLAPWLRQERIDLPIVCLWPSRTDRIVRWGPPRYNTIHRLLTNPVYAGAYVFGRTGSRVRFAEGRKVITRGVHRRRDEWEVLIRDHHNGFISWEEYELNQKDHRGQRQHERRHGAGFGAQRWPNGWACGEANSHNGLRGVARYVCNDADVNTPLEKCIAFGNMRVDAAVSAEVLRVSCPRLRIARAGPERQCWSKRVTRRRVRAGNMMRSIPINDRWPASLNVGGMNVSRCRAA